jgi:tetratricopeptide (TPR) repeat protein
VALDRSYALAWTGLADAYVLSVPGEYNVPGIDPNATLTLAEEAARRAIALAPRLGEAQSSLGEILEKRERWPEATAAFEQGIRLSPAYPTGHQWYSYNLQSYNRWDEAIREMETAHRLDPLSHVITLSLAFVYDGADRFAEATPLYAQGLAQSPEAWYAWMGCVGHELALGHMVEAAAAYRRWAVGDAGLQTAAAAEIERRLRDPATRTAMIEELRKDAAPSTHYEGTALAAIAYVRWLRGAEATVALLQELASSGRGPDSTLILYAFLGPRLRADPRVQALAPKFGGPPLGGAVTR